MVTTRWREVCKFLAGATFVGTIANGYLWATRVSVPFLGTTIPPTVLGVRAIVGSLAFIFFLYVGYLKRTA